MNLPQKQVDIVSLRGGIDLTTPLVAIPKGFALDLLNFEPELEGGYRRISGYERTDGRAAPSDAVYYTLVVADSSVIAVDSDITGGTSGATARVVIKDDTENTLGITNLSGDFQVDETVGTTTVVETESLFGIDDINQSNTWQLAAEDYYRSLIGPVPGDGSVLGAVQYLATRYSFRADAGTVKLYKSSTTGWTLVPFFDVLFYDAGSMSEGEITAGTVIDGATSGAQGTVKTFIKNAGSYGTDASGYMVLNVTSGTFQDNENLEVAGAIKAKANGANTPITLAEGGKFRFIQHNFFASSGTLYLYGTDGVNPAFQFDGETLVPIYFPAPDQDPSFNTPSYLFAHRNHLFLSFPGGSMAHSSPGEPLIFSGLLGAAEFGLGDEINGMEERAGNVLAIYTRRQAYGLYGTGIANWELRVISETFGAQADTVQKLGTVFALDDKGIAPLERVQAFGDFENATVSRKIKPILDRFRGRVIGSVVIKDRNQYRLFFDNGRGLILTDDRYAADQLPAFSSFEFKHIPTCLSAAPDENGEDVVLFGGADGFVYQMERGYNFDGETIPFAYRSSFMHQKSPQARKSYRRLYMDIATDQAVTFSLATDLGYGDFKIPTARVNNLATSGGGGFWNVADWNEFFWDAPPFSSSGVSITGTAQNLSLLIYGDSAVIRSFTLQTLEIHYLTRRIKRE